jgi:type VI secretion system protein ImpJ
MQPVLWTKGVLLSPQHLQTQDRFLEDQIQFQLASLTFCPWGFSRLDIDREALAGGTFAITSAAGIFPDGLLFDIPGADPGPQEKKLDGAFEQDQDTLDIYLAIPEYRYGGYNVSAAQRDRGTRYRAEELLRRDETTGLAERPIQVAKKNFRVLVEGESLEGTSSLRVAQVLRSPIGEYQLDPRFVPPMLDVAASNYLMEIARRLVEILTAKSSLLSGTRRQRNQSLAEFGIADVANFWLLYTMNTYFPEIRHIFETRRGHPAELFAAMLSLAGALTTFSTTVHPRDLPTYEHDALARCFTSLDEIVRTLLETVVPVSYVSLPLRQVQPSVFVTALEQDRYFAAPQLFLAVSAEGKPAELMQKTAQLVKISSHDNVDRLIRQALPGLPLSFTPNPPSAVPVKLNYQYFQLSKSGPEWEAILRSRNLAAYVPADFPNPQLELVVVLPTDR